MLKSSKECITLIEIFKGIYKDLPDESIQEFADSLREAYPEKPLHNKSRFLGSAPLKYVF